MMNAWVKKKKLNLMNVDALETLGRGKNKRIFCLGCGNYLSIQTFKG